MKQICALCLLLLTFSAPSLAEDWHQISQDNGLEIYVDMDSLERSGNMVTTHQKFVHTAPGKFGETKLVVTVRKDKTFRLDKIKRYDRQGKFVDEGSSESFDPIAPGSPIEAVYNKVF